METKQKAPGSMRIWLVVAAIGAALFVLAFAAGQSTGYFGLLAVACLIVGVGGALWETATKADQR